jgi:hypothetical protein
MKLEFVGQIFGKYSDTKFNENPSFGSRVVPRGQTDRHYVNATKIFPTEVIENLKILFFPEIHVVGEILGKNTLNPVRPQMATEYGACALHAG